MEEKKSVKMSFTTFIILAIIFAFIVVLVCGYIIKLKRGTSVAVLDSTTVIASEDLKAPIQIN